MLVGLASDSWGYDGQLTGSVAHYGVPVHLTMPHKQFQAVYRSNNN